MRIGKINYKGYRLFYDVIYRNGNKARISITNISHLCLGIIVITKFVYKPFLEKKFKYKYLFKEIKRDSNE